MQASEVSQTIKVKPWGKDQGEFVEINADEFDPSFHKHFGGEPAAPSQEAQPVPASPKAPAKKVSRNRKA